MIRGLSALLLAAAVIAPSAPSPLVAKDIPVVTVRAKDFAFGLPKSIQAGQTSFRLVNDGKELHHLSVIKLEDGKTFDDFMAALKAGGPPPAWAVDAGGPNAAAPGRTVEATLTLEAGNYVLSCWIPSPGEQAPHAMKGMIQPLTVVPAGSGVMQAGAEIGSTPAPVPTVHLVLKDYGFEFSKELAAGKHVVHVMNEAPQPHEVIFVKLAPGKSMQDFTKWAFEEHMKGPPPGALIDGLAAIAKGRTAIFTADLTPGDYALFCVVPDSKDGKPHTMHGMMRQFSVK